MFRVKHTFSVSALYRQQVAPLQDFLSDRWSFWLALFSCIAFLVGNMVGQHGFQAFWKSVWGKDAEIVFDGAVMPIARIPDPDRWTGSRDRFEFSDVPEALLIPLPPYTLSASCAPVDGPDHRVYSVAYLGSYEGGGEGCGSHLAVDILVPRNTPVLAVANGSVDRIEERNWGYGNTIVIAHRNAPDPDDARKQTTLYSGYAHLGRMLVKVGDVVRKGQQIAFSGQTGFATTPHLHFQMDLADAPFHPYWPFTTSEATEAGYSFTEAVDHGLGKAQARTYTVSPLVYVQAHLGDGSSGMLAQKPREIVSNDSAPAPSPVVPPPVTWAERAKERREKQFASRSTTVHRTEAVKAVSSLTILHDGAFDGRDFERLILFARDAAGNFLPSVHFEGTLRFETVFGAAEFSPAEVTAADFDDHGRAFVKMLPRGQKTIVPVVRGSIESQGAPMVYANRPILSAAPGTERRARASDRVSTTLGE